MRILTHIGEAAAEVGGKTYLVRPSFRALSTIEDLEDEISAVCAAYNLLLSGVTPKVWQLCSCANVLRSCSDMPHEWFGELVDRAGKWKYKFNKLSMRELVIMAHHCIKWGIYGDPKEKLSKAAKKALAEQEQRPFDPHEFVSVLIDEFHLSSSDAWDATMTEFQRLCEHRQRKAWGNKPPPIDDDERENLQASYKEFLKRKAAGHAVVTDKRRK